MKVFVFALAVLAVGTSAGPQDANQARFVDGIVAGLIEDLSQDIRDAGLDPIKRKQESFDFKLPVTDLLLVQAALENLYVEGLSNIVVNNISFSIFSSRLDFDIELPRISAKLGSAAAAVKFFDQQTSGFVSGHVNVVGVRVRGRVVVRISIISGVSISDLTINFTLKGIKSDLKVVIHEKDVSDEVNYVLGEYIPHVIYTFSDDINALLEHYVRQIIEENL